MEAVIQPIKWAGVLIIKDRHVLSLKEFNKPFYIIPGGKVEPGETDEAAAVREGLEELGVPVEVHNLFTVIHENSKSTGQPFRYKLFEGKLLGIIKPDSYPVKTEAVAYINSQYAQDGLEVGNLLLRLLPLLVEQNLID